MMPTDNDIRCHEYLWTTEKDRWVLVRDEDGYGIVNQEDGMMLLVEDDELAGALEARMLEAGCKIYDGIREALPRN